MVADVNTVTAEVAVPQEDLAYVRAGQPATLKLNPYPTRTFEGTVTRLGARLREQGADRVLIAEVRVENPGEVLKTGMLGFGKVHAGRRDFLKEILATLRPGERAELVRLFGRVADELRARELEGARR